MKLAAPVLIALLLVLPHPGAHAASSGTALADLPEEVRAALPDDVAAKSTAEQVEAVFAASTPYRFEQGMLAAFTDTRWFSSLPPGSPGSTILELRRWPGDTRLLLFAIQSPLSSKRDAMPPIADATMELQPGAEDDLAEWRGTIDSELGPRPAIWIEQDIVPESPTYLAALLLPGDAGLGEGAIDDLVTEMRGVFDRTLVDPELWKRQKGLPHGATVELGDLGLPPGVPDESLDPWQVALGTDFTLGLPPGVRARRLDGEVPPPRTVPGGRLWMRGRYVDTEGDRVEIGDADRFGYVARVPLTPEWRSGKQAPLGAPQAKAVAGDGFALAKDKERCAANDARVERWSEPGYDGEWLVFRLAYDEHGVELALPLTAGRQSPSLYWIAISYRAAGRSPAEPPIDPAERFGIKWERLGRADQARRPWMEGYLTVPGLKVELPKNWWPSATLRSRQGFPVRLVYRGGGTKARLARLEPEELATLLASKAGWEEASRPAVYRAEKHYRRASDQALLYVAHEGHAFLFEIADGGQVTAEEWNRMAGSVQLVRSER